MSLLEITGLTHSFGENLLYKNAGFTLNKMEHIGIVGQNGTGKSTLIKICTEQIIPDSGRVIWQPNITIGYLDQYAEIDHTLTVKEFLKSAFAKLFEIETQVMQLYEKAADGDMKNLELAAYYQEQLETHDFYSIDTAIERVANGLGLLAIGLDRPIIEMSGGQRAKVILAKLLLEKPDVLLLDEPTNFLDKDHVAWLAEYLSSLENAFLVVSHDFDFLDKIANRICDIDNDTITKYYGTYSEFLRKKTLLREDYIRQYSAQQKEIKKTEEFIRKNIAGRKAKMARGRQKQLDRMDKMEALEQKEIIPHFHFRELYRDVYTTDFFVDVTEEVMETIRAAERAEAAYERKMYRYKAQYSLDCENGIENAVLLKPQTPEIVLEEKQFQEQVYAAVMRLPEKQAKRIYETRFLAVGKTDISPPISESI